MAGNRLLGSKPPTIYGPRLADLAVQGSDYGQPIPKIYGRIRTAGNLIWSTGRKERTIREEVGGGSGAPEQETVEYQYSTSVAILVGEGPIDRIEKIWADNKVIYMWNDGDQKGWELEQDEYGTWSGVKDEVELRVYTGTQTQNPDPAIETDKGIGRVPAYRGRIVVVLTGFQLADYGNNVPTFTFLVKNGEADAKRIAVDISKQVQLEEDSLNFNSIEGLVTEGFICNERQSARTYMEVLQQIFYFDFVETGTKVKSIMRGGEPVATLLRKELSTHEPGQEFNRGETIRAQEAEMPREVELRYIDINRNYDTGLQRCKRQTRYSEKKIAVSLPVAMTDVRARQIADNVCYMAWVRRQGANVSASWKYLWLDPGDIVLVEEEGGLGRYMISEAQESLFGPIALSLLSDDADVNEDAPYLSTEGLPDSSVPVYDGFTAWLIDNNAPIDEFNVRAGYGVVATTPYTSSWKPVQLIGRELHAPSDQYYYSNKAHIPISVRSTMGNVVSSTGSFSGGSYFWDTGSTITVDLIYGNLTAKTEEEVFAGNNWAYLGDEIIGFCNATPIINPLDINGRWDGKQRYEISHMLRGRRGTEASIQNHVTSTRFILIDSTVTFAAVRKEYIGNNVSIYIDNPGGGKVEFDGTFFAKNLKPYSPYDLKAVRSGSDITISWTGRTRYSDYSWTTGALAEMGEYRQVYEVDVVVGGIVKRTVTVNDMSQFVYTLGQQTADGTSAATELDLRVYQMSSAVGRGYVGAATVEIE